MPERALAGRSDTIAELAPPVLRGDTSYLVRQVPTRYAEIDARQKVWISLATDSREVADAKAPIVWKQLIAAGESRLVGDTAGARQRLDAAKVMAGSRGFGYLPAAKVGRLPIQQIVARVDASADRHFAEHQAEARQVPAMAWLGKPPASCPAPGRP